MRLKKPIVVEGPDGSGKTTLIAKVSEWLNVPVFHTGGPPATKEELLDRIHRIEAAQFDCVFDRVPFISEPIYRKADGKPMLIPEEELRQGLVRMNPTIIWCELPTVQDMFAGISTEKKSHKSDEHLQEVFRNYHRIAALYRETKKELRASGFDIIQWNYKKGWEVTLRYRIRRNLACAA